MICTRCGAQTADNSKFCSVCGAPLETVFPFQTGEMVKPSGFSNKRNILIIAIVLIVLITGGIVTAAAVNRRLNDPDYVAALAERYLDEMKYERAVIEFKRAIRLDRMNPEVYVGLAKAYLKLDDEDRAIDILEEGYEETQSNKIVKFVQKYALDVYAVPENDSPICGIDIDEFYDDFAEYWQDIKRDPMDAEAYIELADEYLDIDDEENAVDILAEGYEKTHSDRIVDYAEKHRLKVPGLPEESSSSSSSNPNEYVDPAFEAFKKQFEGL